MKNFVIATVSAVALLSTAALAEEYQSANKPTETREAAHQMEAKEAHPMKAKEDCPTHHKKKKRHHAKKHHHHVDRGHRGGPLAVFVNYPPVNVAAFSACPCEYYQGNQECRYVYHEGYYWYPQMRADLMVGYQPHHMHGYYWYPSRLHPHAVYVEMQSPMHPSLYAVPMGMAAAHHKMHGKHHRHHGKKHHHRHHAVKHHAPAHQPMAPVHPAAPAM